MPALKRMVIYSSQTRNIYTNKSSYTLIITGTVKCPLPGLIEKTHDVPHSTSKGAYMPVLKEFQTRMCSRQSICIRSKFLS